MVYSSQMQRTRVCVFYGVTMGFVKHWQGIIACTLIALPSWFLGKLLPVIGGPVIAITAGMTAAVLWKNKGQAEAGIKFVSKKVLQWAVILLGFGLNYTVVLETGRQSLPIIVCTLAASLVTAFFLQKAMKMPAHISVFYFVFYRSLAYYDPCTEIRRKQRGFFSA